MRASAFPIAVLLDAAYGIVFAQGISESTEHLRACSPTESAARLECVETPSRNLGQPARAAAGSDNWLVSETTSPVDYSPIVIASTLSRGGTAMQLSIHCRAGTGFAFGGEVVRLLQSLPDEGDFAVRLSTRTGPASEGHFLLDGLNMVREKLATACKWPHAVAKPRN